MRYIYLYTFLFCVFIRRVIINFGIFVNIIVIFIKGVVENEFYLEYFSVLMSFNVYF